MAKRLSQIWKALRRPSSKWAAGTLLLAGAVLALATAVAGNAFVEYSNSLEFCTSCHEMREFVYREYQDSPHYHNTSGVRAICADCHVPRAFFPKMWRKARATLNEVPKHFAGTIDTPEEFEARRTALAEHVWAEMKANDSQACRYCHDPDAMVLASQAPRAKAQHEDALRTGETCIDCHKGIAHKLPETEKAPDEDQDFTL